MDVILLIVFLMVAFELLSPTGSASARTTGTTSVSCGQNSSSGPGGIQNDPLEVGKVLTTCEGASTLK